MISCSLFSGQEYAEAGWDVYSLICLVWLAIFVLVCLIIQIIKAPTEVDIRRSIALESTLFAWHITQRLRKDILLNLSLSIAYLIILVEFKKFKELNGTTGQTSCPR